MIIGLNHYLFVSICMFILGLIGVMKRSNLIMLFISTEILLNAANVALVAIGEYKDDLNGQVFAIFIIGIAASELAVGLGLLVRFYKKTGSFSIQDLQTIGQKDD